jgi:nitroreductase
MNIVAAIEKRHSVRHYDKRAIPPDIVRQVVAVGREAIPLHPEIEIRWHIAWEGRKVAQRLTELSGVYGLSTPAPIYIIATSQERPGYMENLGFCMEQLVLIATAMGLGTCWIGGMFTESEMREFVPSLRPGERIVMLTALGYEDRSIKARMARQLLLWGSDRMGTRKPLREIVSQDIWAVPWTGEDETLNWIFQMARLAPSWANTQPWHFVADEQQVIATVSRVPQRGNVREGKNYYWLDGGIAMCHFYLAAQAMRWKGRWICRARKRGTGRFGSQSGEDHELAQMRARHGIPNEYDILGTFPLPSDAR